MKTIARTLLPIAASCFVSQAFAQSSETDRNTSAELTPYLFPPNDEGSNINSTPLPRAQFEQVRLADTTPANQREDGARQGKRGGRSGGSVEGRRGELEEVIVTAQRREERVQDVPISISVISGEQLDQSTLRDVTEVLSRVPGVTLAQDAALGTYMMPVRGVANAGVVSGLSPTAYYLDSIPFGFNRYPGGPDPDTYDLDRVEVLRGPQGTLYGASALNGVVRVLTRDANLDQFELKARALTSNTEHGDWNYRGDMMINAPIIDRKLAVRGVLGYQELSGWLDKPNKKNANSADRLTGRLKVNAHPIENLSIGASAWFSRDNYDSPSMGFDSETSLNPADEPRSTDYDVYGLHVGYDFPSFSLTSTTGYLQFENTVRVDVVPNDPDLTFYLDEVGTSEVLSQEFALTSTHGGGWRWTAGAMYRRGTDHGIGKVLDFFPTTANDRKSVSESYAVFGELTRLFLDGKWELTGGARYFTDQVKDTQIESLTGRPSPVRPENTFTNVSPRLVLRWLPREELSLYASYGQGFRSGMNQSDLVVQSFPTVAPMKEDSLNNYEVGAKGSLWEHRIVFDTSIYYIDWQDVQQQLIVPVIGGVNQNLFINGNSVSGIGSDFAVTGSLTERWEVTLSASWNDLKFDSDVISDGIVVIQKGDRPSYSAEFTAGASIDYIFPLGAGGLEGQFSTSANYVSEQTARALSEGQVLVANSDPMLVARTSVSLRTSSRWSATMFVDNVTDERGYPQVPPTADAVNNQRSSIRPRTIGLQVDYRY